MMNATVKGECVYCGDPEATTYDHVIPGEPEKVVACVRCNASKRKRTPEQWLADGLIAA